MPMLAGDGPDEWQPWVGGMVELHPAGAWGTQLEIGRHRLPTTYFDLGGGVVGDAEEWRWMVALTISAQVLKW